MSERWLPVIGFGGLYEVSDLGRVRSLNRSWLQTGRGGREYVYRKKGQRLRPGVASNGYPTVTLGRGNTRTVHSLVAEAFIGPCPAGQEVRHRDDDRANPRLDNLEYGTRSQNNFDVSQRDRRRVSRAAVELVKSHTGTLLEAAALAGISQSHAHNIRTGKQRARG